MKNIPSTDEKDTLLKRVSFLFLNKIKNKAVYDTQTLQMINYSSFM